MKSLDTLCAALCYAMGIEAPRQAAAPNEELMNYVNQTLGGQKADRIVMYNPDAIARWIREKYAHWLKAVDCRKGMDLPLCTVMPSVTPVCFGTMYTGAQPEVHGIRKYEKPVIRIDTIFDALIRAGKRPAIVSQVNCSMSQIYREREMDYFIFDTVEESNAKAAELILADHHDFIAVYNTNYDALMHKFGPESPEALSELRANAQAYGVLAQLIESNWKHHNTLLGFAMDHGCHEIDGGCGSHGLDMDEDLHILHSYRAYPKEQ